MRGGDVGSNLWRETKGNKFIYVGEEYDLGGTELQKKESTKMFEEYCYTFIPAEVTYIYLWPWSEVGGEQIPAIGA